jgi:tol-pal system protein YbgF
LASAGCVSKGDFLRLQEKVAEAHASQANEPDPFTRIAKLSTEVEALRQEVRDLQGELELARKESADALVEARRTRTALAAGTAATTSGAGSAKSGAEGGSEAAQGAAALGGSRAASESSPDQELAGYQAALDAWRKDDFKGCIDLFTTFLQKHPTSGYSDDAAYWLADCTYKNDEFKRAVVRFNAVVSVYPDSPKAPDALYRQGESLLKLGPKFHEAARTVFKKVQKDYPESERAAEAARQLERLGTG